MSHSILAPSGAPVWVQCAKWVEMNQLYPNRSGPEAEEGTAAHWVWQQSVMPNLGDIAPNGYPVTEEMLQGAELMLDTIYEHVGGDVEWHVEEKLPITTIHSSCYGTPDFWAYDAATLTLTLIDYKFGYKFVDEYENYQLVAYLEGIIEYLGLLLGMQPGILDQYIKIKAIIVQPRCYQKGNSVRVWQLRGYEIRPYVNTLKMAAEIAMDVDPGATPNENCYYCPGNHVCGALQKDAYRSMAISEQSTPLEMSPQFAALELSMMETALQRLESRIAGLKGFVEVSIKQGKAIPYYHLERSYGNLTWNISDEEVISIGDSCNVDLRKMKVLTPTQAKKEKLPLELIEAFSFKPPRDSKLVRDNPAHVSRIFKEK